MNTNEQHYTTRTISKINKKEKHRIKRRKRPTITSQRKSNGKYIKKRKKIANNRVRGDNYGRPVSTLIIYFTEQPTLLTNNYSTLLDILLYFTILLPPVSV